MTPYDFSLRCHAVDQAGYPPTCERTLI